MKDQTERLFNKESTFPSPCIHSLVKQMSVISLFLYKLYFIMERWVYILSRADIISTVVSETVLRRTLK